MGGPSRIPVRSILRQGFNDRELFGFEGQIFRVSIDGVEDFDPEVAVLGMIAEQFDPAAGAGLCEFAVAESDERLRGCTADRRGFVLEQGE